MSVLSTNAPATVPEGLLLGIDHVGVAVSDLDAGVELYARTFGLVCVHREVNEEQGVREAMLAVAPDAEPCLQLLAPLTPESTIAAFLDRRGPGVQQLAFRVRDVEQVAQVLRDRGLRLLYDTARPGTAGSRVNFVHPKDAGGILVELVQQPQPRAHRS